MNALLQKRGFFLVPAFALFLVVRPSSAAPSSHICEFVDGEYIAIDGMLGDWQEFGAWPLGQKNVDPSLTLRCAYDKINLYLSLHVRDEQIVRSPATSKHEQGDRVVLHLGGRALTRTLTLRPGLGKEPPVYTSTAPSKWFAGGIRKWENRPGSRKPPWIHIEDTLQKRGFSVEIKILRRALPGIDLSSPAIDIVATYHDVDRSRGKAKKLVSRGRLDLLFGAQLFRSLLKKLRVQPSKISVDTLVNVAGGLGAERMIVVGGYVAVLSEHFAFLELPVERAADIFRVRAVDMEGTGQSQILMHYRQRGSIGSRDVVALWSVSTEGAFRRVLAFEVKKQLGSRVLSNQWRFVPRKERAGFDIAVEALPAKGWTQKSYRENQATDMRPILLPWQEKRKVVYSVEKGVAAPPVRQPVP